MKNEAKHFENKLNENIEKPLQRKSRNNNKKIPTYQKILLIIFIIVFIYSAITLINWYSNASKTEEKYENIVSEVIDVEENIINFEQLKNINSDVIGWIQIDNTNINYPIMQTTDNEFYLTKDIYKQYDQCGSLFMDYKNVSDFSDKNNVIYGHHIKTGIMFADLVNIYKGKLGNNIDINVTIPDREMKFRVFSSYMIEPEDYSINTSIKQEEYVDFINTLKNRSEISFESSETQQSNKILTLSTCDRSGQKRILVHAVLEN